MFAPVQATHEYLGQLVNRPLLFVCKSFGFVGVPSKDTKNRRAAPLSSENKMTRTAANTKRLTSPRGQNFDKTDERPIIPWNQITPRFFLCFSGAWVIKPRYNNFVCVQLGSVVWLSNKPLFPKNLIDC